MKSVLVDSSVWIAYFRGTTDILDRLVEEDLICTNEVILTELLPAVEKSGNKKLIESLLALPTIPLNIDWPLLRQMQLDNLKNGINKVGIPDLIILQQIIDFRLELLTTDKHFKLMQEVFDFDLYEG